MYTKSTAPFFYGLLTEDTVIRRNALDINSDISLSTHDQSPWLSHPANKKLKLEGPRPPVSSTCTSRSHTHYGLKGGVGNQVLGVCTSVFIGCCTYRTV